MRGCTEGCHAVGLSRARRMYSTSTQEQRRIYVANGSEQGILCSKSGNTNNVRAGLHVGSETTVTHRSSHHPLPLTAANLD